MKESSLARLEWIFPLNSGGLGEKKKKKETQKNKEKQQEKK
jgi:hypothetical protein